MNIKQKIKNLFLLILPAAVLFSSCNSYEKLTYLRNIDEKRDSVFVKQKEPYRLQPSDILYIRFITGDEKMDALFNPMTTGGNMSNMMSSGGGALYLMGYSVDDSGYIELPLIRKVKVQGLTVREAKEKVYQLSLNYLKDPQLIFKLSTFEFTMLGEINSPGAKSAQTDQLNILEAIAMGGDISYNGNRKNVLIIRQVENGSKTLRVDLTDKNIIQTKDYYIQPNDIIYVEPLETTLFRETVTDYTFIMGTVTSVLSFITFLLALSKL
ncbi:polysaccharide biosynthesis/export family protein [Bacteroidota bacterium]